MYSDDESHGDSSNLVNSLYKRVKHRTELKKMAKEFLNDHEYSAAKEALESLLKIQEDNDDRLDSILRIAECDLMLGRKIKHITDRDIMKLLKSCDKTGYDMREIGQHGNDSQSIIASLYACKLFKQMPETNKALKMMESCIMKSAQDIAEMAKDRNRKTIALKIYTVLEHMLAQMKEVPDANIEMMVLSQSACVAKVGFALNHLGKKFEAFDVMKEGREFMRSSIGEHASKFHAYAAMSNNMAAALVRQGKFEEAAIYHRMSISEMEAAEDIDYLEKNKQLTDFRESLQWVEHMVVWLKDKGVYEDAVLEMACEAAFGDHSQEEVVKNLKESGFIPFESDHLFENPAPRWMRREENETLRTPSISEQCEIAAKEVVSNGSIKNETDQKVLAHLERDGVSWESIRKMADSSSGANAMILYYYTCKLLPFSETEPDRVLREVQECIKRSRVVIDEIVKGSGCELGKKLVWLIYRMVRELTLVKQCNEDSKVKYQANCLDKLGSAYILVLEYSDALKFLSKARQILHNHLGPNCSSLYVYASLANNMAQAHAGKLEHAKSAEFYESAIEDIRSADDISETLKNEKLAAYNKRLIAVLSKTERKSTSKSHTSRVNRSLELGTERDKSSTSGASFKASTSKKGTTSKVEPSASFVASQGPTEQLESNMTERKGNVAPVGDGISVDHTRPLRKGYDVYHGVLHGEHVAVKRIESSDGRTKQEVSIMKDLPKHPNTVEYKAWCEWNSKEMPGIKALYLAMELCQEDTLFEMAMKEDFSIQDRLSCLQQFTSALVHIHDHNIVHGDLKPQNLLRSLGEGVVKVTDFGLSKRLQSHRSHITPSVDAGSIGWMAPERAISKYADIFSAGLIYFYLLSKGQMYQKREDFQILNFHDAAIASQLMSRMLDKDPTKRPTAKECLNSPLFWDNGRKLRFIYNFSEQLSLMPPNSKLLEFLEGDWASTLIPNEDGTPSHKDDKAFEALLKKVGTEVEGLSSLRSVIELVANCCDLLQSKNQEISAIFSNKKDLWTFFQSRFKSLFLVTYKTAQQCGYFWSPKDKLRYLREIAANSEWKTVIDDRVKSVFQHNWFDNLLLDKATAERIQEKVGARGRRSRVGKHCIYNKATSNDRKEESEYDEYSVHSLLTFIYNRQKFFEEDGIVVKCIFGDDTEGVLEFFSTRFPNLLVDVAVCLHDVDETFRPK